MPYPTTFQFISEKDVKTFKKTNCSELFVKPILKGWQGYFLHPCPHVKKICEIYQFRICLV